MVVVIITKIWEIATEYGPENFPRCSDVIKYAETANGGAKRVSLNSRLIITITVTRTMNEIKRKFFSIHKILLFKCIYYFFI